MAPRLRQVALVAHDLAATCAQIEDTLGLRDPFHDPGVAEFGLTNAVYEMDDTFLEVVSPATEGTTAGRYLERRGGDAGYMLIFQVADTEATRARAAAMGVRTVWRVDLDDISGTHLHPADMKGAIVSFDTPKRPQTWRWAGPRWTAAAPPDRHSPSTITGATVKVPDVDDARRRWSELLGAELVEFEPATDASDEGIVAVHVRPLETDTTICGVRFTGGRA